MIKCMHHVAYKCSDAEATRHFYEDILGLPLSHVIKLDHIPSTGEYCPYVHIFFELEDGSSLAFFDIGDGRQTQLDAHTPKWLQHCAMEVASVEQLLDYKQRLQNAGIEVLGPTDHGFVKSIYFFDPNGLKMELTARTSDAGELAEFRAKARATLDDYTQRERLNSV